MISKFLGIALYILGVLFFIGGVIGGFVGALALAAYAIYEAIQVFQGDSVTFLQIFWIVAMWSLREVGAVIAIMISWFLGTLCCASGAYLCRSKQKKQQIANATAIAARLRRRMGR